MSDIFVSHSGADNEVAVKVRAWLREQGHNSIFLDVDKESGIAAGRTWERTLYQNLQSCRAVIVLCSENSMASRWVFAEITHARALGKHIFPVLIGDCQMDSILSDHQAVDLDRDEIEAFERLAQGLSIAGIDSRDSFEWDRERSPYPGLLAFDEKDAAIFFGRSREIGSGLDLLHRVSRYGGSGLVMVLGSSGSGKSSLVRAGLLPRLRRDGGGWLILDPIRPRSDPMRPLAEGICRAYRELGEERDRNAIQRDLLLTASGLGGSGADAADPLVELCRCLSDARSASDEWSEEARVLVIIDQFEELLGEDNEAGRRFLAYLRRTLQRPDVPLLALGTMRSDFLGELQQASALRGFEFSSLSLGPMPRESLQEVIEKPAAMVDGLEIEPELVHAILEDAETADALPLVAFTLSKLHQDFRHDGVLRLSEYRDQLGGLKGSIASAAEAVIRDAALDLAATAKVRQAFLKLVRINEEGQFTRRPAAWSELPSEATGTLERFIQARLLVARGETGDGTLEVAHEAMFGAWDRLVGWLREGREELLLSREVSARARAWKESGRSRDDILPSSRLQRVIELDAEDRLTLGDDERAFVEASRQVAVAAGRRRRRFLAAAGIFLALIAVAMTALFVRAERERRRTALQASRVLAIQAQTMIDSNLDLALLLGLEAFKVADTFESRTSLNAALHKEPRFRQFLHGHTGRVWGLAMDPDGVHLASAGGDGTIKVWNLPRGRQVASFTPAAGQLIYGVAYHPEGRSIVSAAADGRVALWNPSNGALLRELHRPAEGGEAPANAHGAFAFSAAFDPTGRRIVTAAGDGTVSVWEAATGERLHSFRDHGEKAWVWSAAFHPTRDLVASADQDGGIVVRDLENGTVERATADTGLFSMTFSATGDQLAVGRSDGAIQMWDLATLTPGPKLLPESETERGEIRGIARVPESRWIAAAATNNIVLVWDPDRGTVAYDLPAGDGSTEVAFDRHGMTLATAGDDGVLRIWDVDRPPLVTPLDGHDRRLLAIAQSADGGRTASADIGGTAIVRDGETAVRLVSTEVSGEPPRAHTDELWGLAVHPDGDLVATASRDDPVRLWRAATGELVAELEPAEGLADNLFLWATAMSPSGRYVATANHSGVVRVWDAPERTFLRELAPPGEGAVQAVAFDPEETVLAAVGADGGVHLWTLDGKWSHTPLPGSVPGSRVLAFDAPGETLASGDRDGNILLWDVASRALVHEPLAAQEARIRSLAFRSDGLRLISGAQDGSLFLFSRDDRTAPFAPSLELVGHQSPVLYARFDPAGEHRIVSASERLLTWEVEEFSDPERVFERVCRRAGRSLRESEWRQFVSTTRPLDPVCGDLGTLPEATDG